FRVEDVREHAPPRRHVDRLAGDAQLWIRRDRRDGVTGHLDLWHDRDEARLRIRDDFTRIVLRVEAAVAPAVVLRVGPAIPADERFLSPGADLRQLRVLLDL